MRAIGLRADSTAAAVRTAATGARDAGQGTAVAVDRGGA